jgi:hypothetical protein
MNGLTVVADDKTLDRLPDRSTFGRPLPPRPETRTGRDPSHILRNVSHVVHDDIPRQVGFAGSYSEEVNGVTDRRLLLNLREIKLAVFRRYRLADMAWAAALPQDNARRPTDTDKMLARRHFI